MINEINQYSQYIKHEITVELWKQFKSENRSATMYVRLVTPVVYEFYEKFEFGNIEQASIQIENAADKLCLKITQEIVMDIICSRDFRNQKVVFEK